RARLWLGQGTRRRAGFQRGRRMSSLDTWADTFREQASARIGAGNPWMEALRQRAMERFTEHGWPNNRHEGWRHTSLAVLEQQDFAVGAATVNTDAARDTVARLRQDEPGHWLVFVDGHYVDGLSDVGSLP